MNVVCSEAFKIYKIERLSIECRKTKTKVITTANRNKGKYQKGQWEAINNYSPKAKWVLSNNPLSEPEENNCFRIIAQVIIRKTAFSFILLVSFSKTSRNRATAILKISTSVL